MERANYDGLFSDARLSKRGQSLLAGLFQHNDRTILSIAQTRADQRGYYRFLNNERVEEDSISHEMGLRCGCAVAGKTVLCIQDTTEVNLSKHAGRLRPDSGLGPIDAVKKGIGFKVHPGFVMDAFDYMPYGFAGVQLWHRSDDDAAKGGRKPPKRAPIEDKESRKWLEGNKLAEKYLASAREVIIVQDREGDIYEQFITPRLANVQLLIRSRWNRNVDGNDQLYTRLATSQAIGHYETYLPADSHKKTPGRDAIFEVRITSQYLQRPAHKRKRVAPQSELVYAIQATEITSGVTDPVDWTLLTTWAVTDLFTAVQAIWWYQCRWTIEEVFRVLKKECFDIEGSELEQGWAVRKLTLMILDTVTKILGMHVAYSAEEGQDIGAMEVFEPSEVAFLEQVGPSLAGKTAKLSNPHSKGTLKHVVWILARMGGWKGYASQRHFGMTTLLKGVEKFYAAYGLVNFFKDVGTR